MGTGSGKKREKKLEQQADTATAAWQPSALETQQTGRITKFLSDWDTGKDIGDIEYLKPYLNLYNAAAAQTTPETGVGLLGNNQLAGGGGKMAGLIGQQLQSRRQQEASGQLYNAANAAHAEATGNQIPFLVGTEQGRLAGKAGLANQRYTSYLNRPKKPSIWEQLLGGAAQVGAGYFAGGGRI